MTAQNYVVPEPGKDFPAQRCNNPVEAQLRKRKAKRNYFLQEKGEKRKVFDKK